MLHRGCLILMVALVACDADPEIQPDTSTVTTTTTTTTESSGYTSGTRLRARYLDGADGSRQFIGWRDNERDEDCAFQIVNGNYRCMPAAQTAAGYYQDAGCTNPLLHVAPGCQPQYQYAWRVDGTCPESTRYLHYFGGMVAGPVYVGQPGTCTMVPSPAGTLYQLGPVISEAEFVDADEMVE